MQSKNVTLTISRPDQDLTVEVTVSSFGAVPTHAIDEDGNEVDLTHEEMAEVIARALAGEDETGI